MIVEIDNMSKSFGSNLILSNVNIKIDDHDRIGLIGENGKGKSTLLNLIAGEYDCDEGNISLSKNKKIGYLKQDSGLDFSGTIISEMKSVYKDVLSSEEKLHSIETEISQFDHKSIHYQELIASYENEKNYFESKDGYNIDYKIKNVLQGMGFSGFNLDTQVDRLSGGERTRLSISKLLLENPDLLILDEPTNHLDFKTLSWLEDYLSSYKGAILTVSHDRYFLDKIVNRILEVEDKKIVSYPTGYSGYIELKKARISRLQKEHEKQMKEIEEAEDFIQKNIVRASTTKRAQSREKELEKMEIKEKPPSPEKPPKFSFHYEHEPVKDILNVHDLKLEVGSGNEYKLLNKAIDFSVKRGEKIAIVGANGIGKSTFIKTILGINPLDEEKIEWGRNVKVGYYDQHNSYLNPNLSIIDQMWEIFPRSDEFTLRTALGHVRLTGESVFKKISVLSGGEKARLSFAILSLKDVNVLVLDEPTNHMDIICKEALDEALSEYSGTIIMVSHDRYLLNKVPSRIVEMFSDKINSYDGKYEDYLCHKEDFVQTIKKEKADSLSKNEYYRTKAQKSEELKIKNAIKRIENEIADGDRRIKEIEEEMKLDSVMSDYEKVNSLCTEISEIKNRQEELMKEWEDIQFNG